MENLNLDNGNMENKNPENKNLDSEPIRLDNEGGNKIIGMLEEAIRHAGFEVRLGETSLVKEYEFGVERVWKATSEDKMMFPDNVVCGIVDEVLTRLENYRTPNRGTIVYGISIFGALRTVQFGKVGVMVIVRIARDVAALMRNDMEDSE
jgi:hypothetical protein